MKETIGILLVDKANGMTSHDVVQMVRRKLNLKKVGHTGTLDPGATGLLILLLGKATKKSQQFSGLNKTYDAKLTLGIKTSTADNTGAVIERKVVPDFSLDVLEETINGFKSQTEQIPPMVSAKKINGQKLYVLARKGIEIKRRPQKITIFEIKISKVDLPNIYFGVSCSKGTYIRTLCDDIGERLGCGAHMSELRRTSCGQYKIEDAIAVRGILELAREKVEERIIPI